MIASVLLLARKRFAVQAFLASLIAMVITAIHNYVFPNGFEVAGDLFFILFTGAIFVVAVTLFRYAHAMQKRGVLT